MSVLAVGVATLDIINLVAECPREDEKIRALAGYRCRGGNAANTLSVLRQLGRDCYWAGVLAEDADSRYILDDLQSQGIDCRHAVRQPDGTTPLSCITLSQATGSRTIVHHRDLREFTAADFAAIDLRPFSWVHFEGRNVPELPGMLQRVSRVPGLGCSLEVEKPRPGIEQLFGYPQMVIFSREYVTQAGFDAAGPFLHWIRPSCRDEALLICPWGRQGAFATDREDRVVHAPAYPPPQLLDTLGAGDVFNAALIHAHLNGLSISETLDQACRLAGRKCGRLGLQGLVGAGQ